MSPRGCGVLRLAALLVVLGRAGAASAGAASAAVDLAEEARCASSLPAGRVVVDRLEEEVAVVVLPDGASLCVRRYAIAAGARHEGAVLTDGAPDPAAEEETRTRIAHTRARLLAGSEGGSPW